MAYAPSQFSRIVIMLYIRSLIFNILFFFTLAFGCIIGTIIGLFSRKATIPFWNKIWMPLCCSFLKICGISIEIRGKEYIRQEGVIYAIKHQSSLETYCLSSYITKAVFILKKELTYVPLFGWAQHLYGMIAVNRAAGGATLKKLLHDAKDRIQQGRPIIIFPEGTRTKPGKTTDYKPGLVFLYQNLNVPVIPVAVNTGLFWAKNSFLRYPGKVVIEFLPPLPLNMDKKEFMAQLKEKIEDKCAQLNQESAAKYPHAKMLLENAKKD